MLKNFKFRFFLAVVLMKKLIAEEIMIKFKEIICTDLNNLKYLRLIP